jgi:hypothetical protein
VNIKKISVGAVLALLLVSLSACTVGSGTLTDGSYSYDGIITRLEVSFPATFNIKPESGSEVTYSVDASLVDKLEITYSAGTMKIGVKNNANIVSVRNQVFNISSDALQEIIVTGAAKISGSGTFKADDFALEVDGAGSANLALEAKTVTIDNTGAGTATLTGTTNALAINCQGACTINARGLTAQDAVVAIFGTGTIKLTAEHTLDATVDGAGTITYWGDPELTKSIFGVGTITKG